MGSAVWMKNPEARAFAEADIVPFATAQPVFKGSGLGHVAWWLQVSKCPHKSMVGTDGAVGSQEIESYFSDTLEFSGNYCYKIFFPPLEHATRSTCPPPSKYI